MIQVRLTQNSDFFELTVEGHDSKNFGMDSLLCNAVSVLTQTLLQCLIQKIKDDGYDLKNSQGFCSFRVCNSVFCKIGIKKDALIEFYLTGLKRLENQHPEKIQVLFGSDTEFFSENLDV